MDADHGCVGSRVTSLGDVPVPDEVTFMALGTPDALKEVRITAEHFRANGPDGERFTLFRASTAADTVAERLMGAETARTVAEAVLGGREGQWSAQGVSAAIEKEPHRAGYDLRLRLRPDPSGSAADNPKS